VAGAEHFQFADGTYTSEELAPESTDPIYYAGTEYNDAVTGAAGNDTLYGGKGGDDTFTGRGGDDSISGSSGTDTVIFRGDFADYVITYDPAWQTFTVQDTVEGRDGTDTVTSTEYFEFADVTKTASEITPALHLIGTDDIDALFGNSSNDTL
jgi:serralysin